MARYSFKIALVGDEGVGKTSLIDRYIDNKFSTDYKSTMGANILKKSIVTSKADGKPIEVFFTIWDIAGQKKYDTIRKMYFQGCSGIIFIYDATREPTYKAIKKKWILDAKTFASENSCNILVANKRDLENKIKVGTSMGYKLATEIEAVEFVQTSAKTGENVEKIFNTIVQTLLKKIVLPKEEY